MSYNKLEWIALREAAREARRVPEQIMRACTRGALVMD